ncbi:MAG: hypothetical protein DWQ06_16585 [Calditrichaeota bacterium]|nr:MAG: hypothetical protein DWQ06_16585 [Calditrichota bacterium]
MINKILERRKRIIRSFLKYLVPLLVFTMFGCGKKSDDYRDVYNKIRFESHTTIIPKNLQEGILFKCDKELNMEKEEFEKVFNDCKKFFHKENINEEFPENIRINLVGKSPSEGVLGGWDMEMEKGVNYHIINVLGTINQWNIKYVLAFELSRGIIHQKTGDNIETKLEKGRCGYTALKFIESLGCPQKIQQAVFNFQAPQYREEIQEIQKRQKIARKSIKRILLGD